MCQYPFSLVTLKLDKDAADFIKPVKIFDIVK